MSRSRRWASSSVSCGRSARSASMTPKLTPLPPCTAMPAGLSSTSSLSSSYTMARLSCSPSAVPGRAGSPGGATRTGGMRMRSPSCSAQLRVGAATVDAHLALADEAIQPAARHSRQLPLQAIVQALAGLVLADLVVLHAGARFARLGRGCGVLGVRHCFYNDLEYTLRVVRQVRTRQWLAAMAAARLVGPLKPRPSLGPPRSRQLRRTPYITEVRSERRRLSSPKVTFPSAC